MSSDAVYEGGAVIVTCVYGYHDAKSKPTVTWTFRGQPFTKTQHDGVSNGGSAGTGKEKLMYIKINAVGADSGEYKCSGDYSGNAAESPVQKVQVRVLPAASNQYIPQGKTSTVLTCTVTGDEPATFKWFDGTTAIDDGTAITGVTPKYDIAYDVKDYL